MVVLGISSARDQRRTASTVPNFRHELGLEGSEVKVVMESWTKAALRVHPSQLPTYVSMVLVAAQTALGDRVPTYFSPAVDLCFLEDDGGSQASDQVGGAWCNSLLREWMMALVIGLD